MRRRLLVGVASGGGVSTSNFKTTLWTGTLSSLDVVSEVDSVANDSMLWIKNRDDTVSHKLYDTLRGVPEALESDSSSVESSVAGELVSFNADGFTVNNDNSTNGSGDAMVAWQFIKKEGVFDVIQYVGDGIAGRTVAHSLGSDFGLILIKNRDQADSWAVQHKDVAATETLILDTSVAATTDSAVWNDTAATSTNFTVGTSGSTNANGENYVAYVFASNTGQGITCGSYAGDGTLGQAISGVGFQPSWLLIKRSSGAADWYLFDTSRGGVTSNNQPMLANFNVGESSISGSIDMLSGGFSISQAGDALNGGGSTYVFMAIS